MKKFKIKLNFLYVKNLKKKSKTQFFKCKKDIYTENFKNVTLMIGVILFK